MAKTPVTVAYGDGIGPEIMNATLHVLREAGAAIEPETIEIGRQVYARGNHAGIEPASWESLRRTRVFLKAPVTTPEGSGFQSLNVAMRKTLGLYANVRPCVSYHPFVDTLHPAMDVVIIRENEEDLYTGIEYRLSADETQCIKLISRPGSEKIVRYAFEYARRHNRRKVTCFTKDNVLKMTDGLFHQVFDEIGAAYPEITREHWIVDLGAAKLADTPEVFDVIVLPNLYGDILSDVAAHIAGAIGLAGGANVGDHCAMFEAMQGPAPRRANQNLANPSGLLLASVLMLVHIGQPDVAARIHNAWLRTLEDGIHTYDIHTHGISVEKVGTREFACAVVARLGQKPCSLNPVSYAHVEQKPLPAARGRLEPKQELAGVDVYVEWPSRDGEKLAAALAGVIAAPMSLTLISNRGVTVWPESRPDGFSTDGFRCRFTAAPGTVSQGDIVALLGRMAASGFDIVMTAGLRHFDGQPGYSVAQGQ